MTLVSTGYDLINPLPNYATSYSCSGYPGWNCDSEMAPLVAKPARSWKIGAADHSG